MARSLLRTRRAPSAEETHCRRIIALMCGIAGIVHYQAPAPNRELLTAMRDRLIHRGPDEGGLFCNERVGLAIRRLCIIDIKTGSQPVFNEDKSVVVVLNGEIYNYRELTEELVDKGHAFRTRSDTEVLVHGYEEDGADFVKRLNGMFAFALYDKKSDTLLLSRDRFGKKPLYYLARPEGVIFASELKSLLLHPWAEKKLDPRALCAYFQFGYVPEGYCILSGVQKLPPAHLMKIDLKSTCCETWRYWECLFTREEQSVSMAQALEKFSLLFSDAVRLRMRSDVPVGAFLSGGIDSSSVVAEMASFTDLDKLHTFSIGFDSHKHDESPYALQTAAKFGTLHHNEILTGRKALDLLPAVIEAYDEPFADSSLLPTYFVSRLARQFVTVVLSGDGGDEMLCGYDQFALAPYWDRLQGLSPAGKRWLLLSLAVQRHRARRFVRKALRMGQDPALALHRMLTMSWDGSVTSSIFGGAATSEVAEEVPSLVPHAKGHDPARRMQDYYLHTYLPGDILTKVDRASMAVSLEVRSPFLDYRLAELLAVLPSHLLVNKEGESKRLLSRWAESKLPYDTLTRRKRGFSVPLRRWFRTEWSGLLHAVLGSPHFLERKDGQHLVRSGFLHIKPRKLFALLMLELWYRHHFKGETFL